MGHSRVAPRWPRPLPPGGTVGICSPAGPPDTARLDVAVRAVERSGYRVVVAPQARHRNDTFPYLAGTDEARLSDLNQLLADPGVDMILCARGGYGSMRLLDKIDYEAARADPKPVVGYSDITALSLALAARAGVISFSGIMATAGHGLGEDSLDSFSEASLWAAVGQQRRDGQTGLCLLQSPPDAAPWNILRPPPADNTSVVSGPVFPVCLSLLTALLGTPYLPDLRGAILVIEDVHEELYAVDRCLTQLRLAGLLDSLAALLVGSFNGTDDEQSLRTGVPLLARDLTPPSVPVASGVAYGHIPRRLTLPVGAWADVNFAAGTFAFPGI